jgi:cation diffusion facilitator family transporter
MHSSLDVVSAAIAFATVRIAGKPADEDHPFGHGKIETLSSLFEAMLLVATAAFIVVESIDRVIHPAPVASHGVAIAVMAFSLIASYGVYRHNLKAAFETDSSALHVNALHFLADVATSFAVLAGLVLLHFTGWSGWDPMIGFGVALYIAAISLKQIMSALRELADTGLPDSELQELQIIVAGFKGSDLLDAHDWRTRKSGPHRHVDFHMTVCRELSVRESHDLCDAIEKKIEERFENASVNIHVEPCDLHEQGDCELPCSRRH